MAAVKAACIGQAGCSVPFGADPCPLVVKTLAVRATCAGGSSAKAVPAAVVREGGTVVWDGKSLVGTHAGIRSAADTPEAEVLNGFFSFVATPA